jgi:hypothetical protein
LIELALKRAEGTPTGARLHPLAEHSGWGFRRERWASRQKQVAASAAFYYFLLLLAVFNVVGDWKPLATAGMKSRGKPNVLSDMGSKSN